MKPHKLLDWMLANGFKNDGDIARCWNVNAPVISRIRNGKAEIRAKYILAVYDCTDLTIEQIREML